MKEQQKRAKTQSDNEGGLLRGNISTSSAQTAPAMLLPLRDWRARGSKISRTTAGSSHKSIRREVELERRGTKVELPDLDGPSPVPMAEVAAAAVPPPHLKTNQRTPSSFERAALLFANGYRDSVGSATAPPCRAYSTSGREQGDGEESISCDNMEDDSSLVAILNDGSKEALALPRPPSSPSSSKSRPSSEAQHFGGVSAVIHSPNKAEASQRRVSYDASLLDIIDALDDDEI